MENRGKILIIDDNEDVLFALNLLLEPYVEKVKVTTQPARIEFFMTTFQPDVILLDMNFRRDAISGQEGFDCLEQILKLDPQAIVLFMTAYADTDKAQPGDLIFFTGTYDAGVPVTHIGIYVGNGQMIHCGHPVQYTSINSPYWQSHFYGFGRW